jgi:hypothetical protein
MARDHARLYCAIWNDPDWRALDMAAQHAYMTLLSQPRLSYCGVLDYIPSRFAALTNGSTERKFRAAVATLEGSRFVMVDGSTHELLVRSYVRHDGVLDRPNMGKATARAVGQVVSVPLRDQVLAELGRLMADEPGLSGWIGFKTFDPEAYAMACDMASRMGSAMGSAR